MFRRIIEDISHRTTSKKKVNILYILISMLIALIITLIPIIINYVGIKFAGQNFPRFLLENYLAFSIIIFIAFKQEEKKLKNK